ncbi:tetratricopeptide repeat protein [Tateyamaria sp. Alg231-49]|uniref:tetratricopeptide repeat protein n=1 Tax=Tateyamaria sp. Alg231-49 TaxID=1922219 RepID=UPI000D5512BB|nr:tetratricopeptide repeat protein [Tateyamaria sp. Alg231-49]
MLRTLILTSALALPLALPTAAFAAGGESESKPEKTETTQDCLKAEQWDPEIKKYVRFSQPVNGVWDADIKKCVRPDKTSHLDSDTLYKAVRELAYAGRYGEAIDVLDQMPDQLDDRVLTYRGFTARKLGNLEQANLYYEQALTVNPDNILARSYMGQGNVAAGDKVAAMTQLREIQARGGAGTWAEASLRNAIQSGTTYNY